MAGMARRWILLLVPVGLLLILVLVSSGVLRSGRAARSEGARPEAGPDRPRTRARDATKTESAAEAKPLPAPVDLDAVDRDRDLHGIVEDEDEARVAGARLAVVRCPWRRATMLNVADYDDPEHGPKTRSAEDGTFALRLRRGDLVHLRVEADGFAPQEIPMLTAGERVVVTLTRGPGLRVTVRGESGDALQGVLVRVERTARHGDQAFRHEDGTGTDGTATFEGLPPGVRAGIDAFLEGRVTATPSRARRSRCAARTPTAAASGADRSGRSPITARRRSVSPTTSAGSASPTRARGPTGSRSGAAGTRSCASRWRSKTGTSSTSCSATRAAANSS